MMITTLIGLHVGGKLPIKINNSKPQEILKQTEYEFVTVEEFAKIMKKLDNDNQ